MRKRRARIFSPDSLRRAFRAWLTQHAQACVFSLGQLFKNPFGSLLTTAVIGISLALPAGFYMVLENANRLTENWDGTVQITLFLKQEIEENEAKTLADKLRQRNEVESVRLITRSEALAEYQRVSGFGNVIDTLDENPLPVLLLIRPDINSLNSSQADKLLLELRALKEIDTAQFDRQWVKRLFAIIDILQRSMIILATLLAVAVLLIVGNTIRLAIYNRRAEIEINKLFGATDAFIRRPFLYTGLVHGIGGSLMAWLLLLISVLILQDKVSDLASMYQSHFMLNGLSLLEALLLFAAGGALGLSGSWLAVKQHLSAIEPV